jgi:hypothetical protein
MDFPVPDEDYVMLDERFRWDYRISQRVIDGLMELAEELPNALPGAKRPRPGVEQMLRNNVKMFLAETDPETPEVTNFSYTYRFENVEQDTTNVQNKITFFTKKYYVTIVEEAPELQSHIGYIRIGRLDPTVPGPLFDLAKRAIIRAIEATSRGVDTLRDQRNQEKKMVSEVAVKVGRNMGQTIPEGMLTKQVGKFLGGKRRKTKAKKAKKSRRKTRRST